jgi:hypothetical protein
MSSVKDSLKEKLPAPVYKALQEGRDALVRARQWPARRSIPGDETASNAWQR